jgi:hypothetical protein
MNKAFRVLTTWLDRPQVGAVGVVESLRIRKMGLVWAERIFSHASWLLIFSAALIVWVPLSKKIPLEVERIKVVLGAYSIYVLILEVASRGFKSAYERTSFRFARILANIITVTALVWFSSGVASYFWFFYSIPIFQTVVYFGDRAIFSATTGVIATYWVISVAIANRIAQPLDGALLATNSSALSLLALVSYWLFGFAKESKKHYEALLNVHKIPDLLDTEISLSGFLKEVIKKATEATKASSGSILLFDRQANVLKACVRHPASQLRLETTHEFKLGEGIAGWVAQEMIPYVCPDTTKDPKFISRHTNRQIASLLVVPIVSHGQILGVISVDSPGNDRFGENDTQLLLALAILRAGRDETLRAIW